MQLNAYLMFDGACAEAIEFYAKTLGGSVEMMLRYADMPESGACSPDMGDRIAHRRLVADGQVLMASDCQPGQYRPQQSVSVHVGVADPAEAGRLFQTFAEGGTVCMPLGETFWAHAFGVVTDRFGTSWMINCEKPQ